MTETVRGPPDHSLIREKTAALVDGSRLPPPRDLWRLYDRRGLHMWAITKKKQAHLVHIDCKTGTTYSKVKQSPHKPCDWPKACRTCLRTISLKVSLKLATWYSARVSTAVFRALILVQSKLLISEPYHTQFPLCDVTYSVVLNHPDTTWWQVSEWYVSCNTPYHMPIRVRLGVGLGVKRYDQGRVEWPNHGEARHTNV